MVKDLSEALQQEPATLSPMLKRLEQAGLVTRERMEGNERALAVGLTDAGVALREQALAVPEPCSRAWVWNASSCGN